MALDLHLKRGALHRSLGVPESEKIPKEKLEAASHSPDKLKAKRARLAITMSHWHKNRGKK